MRWRSPDGLVLEMTGTEASYVVTANNRAQALLWLIARSRIRRQLRALDATRLGAIALHGSPAAWLAIYGLDVPDDPIEAARHLLVWQAACAIHVARQDRRVKRPTACGGC